ncbi:hypothetical protein DOU02_06720 [Clavibacter michiganensis subsp. michiganensis]|uniref:hypothetical protein n=1 Tax=Clavibacter michiganensis TaxID=28447 RepID=UPI0013031874|nr:hypothetical protein [Clavibacter michiganensis]KAF0258771.1 hypothetical protein DOU02_06720 [Clavibacter michiganensis subsp. michiganensis]
MVSISAADSREIQAVVLALKQMEPTIRKEIYARTRSAIVPAWTEALATKASTSLEQRVLVAGARIQVSPERLRLTVGSSNKRMSGGATTSQLAAAVEFGTNVRKAKITARSKNGKTYTYEKTINRQLKMRRRGGYVAYPSAAEVAPRFVALYVQTVVRTLHEAYEGRSS